MLLDDLDLYIIKNALISKSKELNTWNLAKKYIKTHFVEKTKASIRYHNCQIISRLKRMQKMGILIITKNSETKKNEYNLIGNYIRLAKHNFGDGECETIILKINNTWCAFQCSDIRL